MPEAFYQLAYISRSVSPFGPEDLTALLRSAWRANSDVGVTGMLLYDEPAFLQLLEGTRESVEAIFARIEADQRHRDIDVIYTRDNVPERQFARWQMGCRILGQRTPAEFQALDRRVKDVLRQARGNSETAVQLLLEFRDLDNSGIVEL